jgi:hypothetical protein
MSVKFALNHEKEKNLLQFSAVNAWRRLQPELKVPQRIEVVEGSIPSRIVFRLIGVGNSGSDVIAKRTPQSTALVERTIYEEILPNLLLPMVHYYGSVLEQNSGYYWLFLEDVSGEKYHPHIKKHSIAAAKWLGIMNTSVLKNAEASQLPKRGPDHYLMLLQVSRETILSNLNNPALELADLQLLEAVVAHCDYLNTNWEQFTSVCEEMPKTLVHGDFIPKNVGIRTSQDGITLLPFDWEKAGWGSSAEDISRVDIPSYWHTVHDAWPGLDLQVIHSVANVGRFFRCLVYLEWIVPQFGDNAIEEPMHHLSQCETWLADLIQTLPLRD